jgi:predicted metalloprotease
MKWEDREESKNVDDRRGVKMTGAALGGGGILVVIVYLVAQFMGLDPQQAKQLANVAQKVAPQGQEEQEGPVAQSPQEERAARFSKVILKDTEDVWTDLFRKNGKQYVLPKMKLYREGTRSGCGFAESAVGPFYCPADETVYLDLSFYTDMQEKLGAPGEFARAYVIAHEVGHHVQRLLGYSAIVDRIRQGGNPVETNHASVRLELQADYLAGVWAHHNEKKYKFLEPGDVESAMNAARQIGDDQLQRSAGRPVQPDSFTHGTSKQRMRWFMRGLETGDVGGAAALFKLPYNEL